MMFPFTPGARGPGLPFQSALHCLWPQVAVGDSGELDCGW